MATLHMATTSEEVENVLLNGANIHELNAFGESLLFSACRQGNLQVVIALHRYCHNFETLSAQDRSFVGYIMINYNEYGRMVSPIEIAAKEGHWPIVEFLISRRYDSSGVLYFSALGGNTDVIDYLFLNFNYIKNINLALHDDPLATPLNAACFTARIDTVEKLLSYGSVVDKYSFYFLCFNAMQGKVNDVTISHILSLLAIHCPINIRDITQEIWKCGNTIMHMLSLKKKLRSLNLLIGMGGNIDAEDKLGRSSLRALCENQTSNLKTVRLLVDNGAYLNAQDSSGNSLLIIACCNKNTKLAEILIRGGADVNLCNKYGETPLYSMCKNYNGKESFKIIQLLIENGANVNVYDINGNGLLHLMFLCREPDIETINFLIDCCIDINIGCKDGNTPLHKACNNYNSNYFEVLRLLVNRGANVNYLNKNRLNALDHVITSSEEAFHLDAISFLIKSGSDLKSRDVRMRTVLHNTCYQRCENLKEYVIQLLINDGADINAQDDRGFTPLHIVSYYPDGERKDNIIRLLLSNGADASITDNDGDIP